jgi:hypothetical protein
MCYIYNADVYCDDCGNAIKRDLAEHYYKGRACEALPDGATGVHFTSVKDCAGYLEDMDERDYDSGDYPKYGSDDEACDSPQHCGSGGDCVNAIEFEEHSSIGCLICSNLTDDGIEYVKEVVREGGRVADFWRVEFSWVDFD